MSRWNHYYLGFEVLNICKALSLSEKSLWIPCLVDLSKVQLNQRDAILGKTALHICAERDDADGCRILLAAGADPKIKDKHDKQARGMKIFDFLQPRAQSSPVSRKLQS